jgi:Asp-tRNA(Asn)/Glu-tRNA(Gln) amidotransferase A subunit family amidase
LTELVARRVTDLAPALASGALTVRALVTALLARIDATDAGVKAWAHLDRELALSEAGRLDAMPADARGHAFGMPLGVKDIIDTDDQPTQLGSPIGARRRPSKDATCIARWRGAGGLVLGKTVTTEFAFMHPGATANPWNPRHTPGGSSSGSAAAVALGQVPAAIGTQTNGSVIRPAAYCGVVGFKPTLGLVPFDGAHLFSPTFDTLGTFTRSVGDAAYVMHALAPSIARQVAMPSRPPRVAFVDRFPWMHDIGDGGALDRAAGQLRMAGAEVVPVAIPVALEAVRDVQRTIMLAEAAHALGPLQDRERPRMSATLNAGVDQGRAIGADALARAHVARLTMIAAATAWLADYDALVVPSAPAPAPEGLATTGDPSCCTLASLLGFPAITIPVAHAANGLPIGMQLVGRGDEDNGLLSSAAWCEAKLPRWRGLL